MGRFREKVPMRRRMSSRDSLEERRLHISEEKSSCTAEGVFGFSGLYPKGAERQANERVRIWQRSCWERNPDVILVCQEVGYGVVPMDAFDRKYREAGGKSLHQAWLPAADKVTQGCVRDRDGDQKCLSCFVDPSRRDCRQ